MDDAAMQTRRMVLESAGHSVNIATDLRHVIAACERIQFAVAVLGHHMPLKEKLRVSDVVRELCPKAKILELHASLAPDTLDVDGHLSVNADNFPEKLVAAVGRLTALKKRRGDTGSASK
jgi:CheY-like chemotaxis protein